MKLFTAAQIKELDNYTIVNEPISSIELMERASGKLLKVFKSLFQRNKEVVVFAGPGNNGGDGLALARMLLNNNYNVEVYLCAATDKVSPDCKTNYDRLHSIGATPKLLTSESLPELNTKIVVDAIFGSGLSRKAEGFYEHIIQHINSSYCHVFSVDVPSGLFCESNTNNNKNAIIKASTTVSFQVPKLAYFFAENEQYTGKIHIEDIGLMSEAIQNIATPFKLVDKLYINQHLKHRAKFTHKGNVGHALLIAGSHGKIGAAVLASKGCLKSGVGLLTTHVPCCGYQILQTSVPEAMTSSDRSEFLISGAPKLDGFNGIGIGPGIGTKPNTALMLKNLLQACDLPMVIDADGLNILAKEPSLLKLLPEQSILTPHPGEFKRLFGEYNDGYERTLKQLELSKQFNCIIVLKGAHTAITTPSGNCYFNGTGNPGMATAGSGDVLTGILTALLAQGYNSEQAAVIGTWVHGKAADIFVADNSMEALTASDICNNLGYAFKQAHNTERKENYF